MRKAKRIFFISDTKDFTDKLLLAMLRKEIKGFIRLGHDVQVFSYNEAFRYVSPVTNPKWVVRQYKSRVDELLVKQIRNYEPDIIHISFAKFLDARTVGHIREAACDAAIVGIDVDPWPKVQRDRRIETAKKLDILTATNDGQFLQDYKDAGVPKCVFIPNMCDPDIEYRYDVSDKWKSDILFTGQTKYKHKRYPTEDLRYQLLVRLADMKNCALYGCLGRPKVEGINYLYAISGAKIGLSINAVNDVRLYHSDRFTHYLACGTFVLAKRVPDSELLFKDKVHLRYFDAAEEFFDLANWYLAHEDERIKIANAGMQRAHSEFNCEKIAKYTLDIIETGDYKAPWTV
jgi:glycosyltransferase involved in cell wall biosynthesis